MCDKLVFDLSQEIEGSPNVFIRKDWINILDNQNQNYNNNQSVVDTSQLSNSNKYMSYRESYFSVPLLATLTQTSLSDGTLYATNTTGFSPATTATSADYAIGLKNWFGQIIHSFTLDYNGTTICQQTPYINMWNSFKLLTSLSLDDINTQGATIGFYPDDATSWTFQDALTMNGVRTLTLANGTVKLKSSATSTVGDFVTTGSTLKYLQSSTNGTQATISKASGTVTVTYLSIKDSNAAGSAVWLASDATNVDAGNNTGWYFSPPPTPTSTGNMFIIFN